jgi:hypothetical protein
VDIVAIKPIRCWSVEDAPKKYRNMFKDEEDGLEWIIAVGDYNDAAGRNIATGSLGNTAIVKTTTDGEYVVGAYWVDDSDQY